MPPPPPPVAATPRPTPAPPPTYVSAVTSRYASYSATELDTWLAVAELSQPVVLALSGADPYDAHTALRHADELQNSRHEILVTMSKEIRKDRAFTPWFRTSETCRQDEHREHRGSKPASVCVMRFAASTRHSDASASKHFACFDTRIAGTTVPHCLTQVPLVAACLRNLPTEWPYIGKSGSTGHRSWW